MPSGCSIFTGWWASENAAAHSDYVIYGWLNSTTFVCMLTVIKVLTLHFGAVTIIMYIIHHRLSVTMWLPVKSIPVLSTYSYVSTYVCIVCRLEMIMVMGFPSHFHWESRWNPMGMGIDDAIWNRNGKEWESPCMGTGMPLFPWK